MINFQYARATDVADAVRQIAADPTREIHRRRHQPDRPDEGRCRAPDAADRHLAPAAQERRGDGGGRLADRRAGAELRPRLSSAGRAALSAACERDPGGRVGSSCATWRRPAAISCSGRAAPISTTPRRPATSASPAAAARRVEGLNRMHAILGASEACIAVHPSDMCVALRGARRHGACDRAGRASARIAFADFHRLPGDTPQRDTNLRAERDHHGDRASGEGLLDQLHLPENPRPPVLRLRARFDRGGAGARRRHDHGGAARARRRRAQAVARRGRGGRAARAGAERRGLSARGRRAAARRQGLRAQRLQDRARAPRHRSRADAGGGAARRNRSPTRRSCERGDTMATDVSRRRCCRARSRSGRSGLDGPAHAGRRRPQPRSAGQSR